MAFVSYLMLTTFIKKISNGTIYPGIISEFTPFTSSKKANVIERVEFEHVHNDVTVHHLSHFDTELINRFIFRSYVYIPVVRRLFEEILKVLLLIRDTQFISQGFFFFSFSFLIFSFFLLFYLHLKFETLFFIILSFYIFDLISLTIHSVIFIYSIFP